MLAINEEFYSIQGEGLHTGIPMYFVRLQGCEVGCYFCDTKYTWRKEEAKYETNELAIIERVLKSEAKWICITGGEPYEQDLTRLVELASANQLNVQVETSGTVWKDYGFIWICCSPKDLFSKKKTLPEFAAKADEFKCVVTKMEDVEYYLQNYYFQTRVLTFQPVDNNVSLITKILERIKGMDNIRIMLQQHKVMNLQ